jgi:hypothetical protein
VGDFEHVVGQPRHGLVVLVELLAVCSETLPQGIADFVEAVGVRVGATPREQIEHVSPVALFKDIRRVEATEDIEEAREVAAFLGASGVMGWDPTWKGLFVPGIERVVRLIWQHRKPDQDADIVKKCDVEARAHHAS